MREILFRGKDRFDGEWYVGSLTHDRKYGNCFIEICVHQGITKEVIPETVGQYTGLKDKNGTKIFEGDILKISFGKDTLKAVVKFDYYNQPDKILKTHLGFYFDFVNTVDREFFRKDVGFWTGRTFSEIEVIGNIHDNPKLLEVAENE